MEPSNLIKNSNDKKKQDNVATGNKSSANQRNANLSSLNYVTLDDNAKLANISKVEYLEPNVQSAPCPDVKRVPQPGRSDYEFVLEPGYVTPASITG
ncbi:unnamed protein product [Clavelina lepadiformis]|uniref:Uncharacterized protein n=1 Tax=Clavelina lepadiformis TaxID=159417 RepID=A0ABP0H2N2_CLALP